MTHASLDIQEITNRGERIYQEKLRHQFEPLHRGKFLIVDVESEDYEIDADDLTATNRLLARHPTAMTYGVRIGFPTAYRLGGRFLAVEQ